MADLVVTIIESITLNNKDHGGTISKTMTGINNIYKRIVTVPNGVDTTVASFKSTVGIADSAMDIQNVKYIRVTNLDSTNPINLSLQIDAGGDDSAADASCTILVTAGKSFIMGAPHEGIHADDDAATLISSLVDLESIIVDSSSNDVDVEVLIASA
jgi:hypothetical protein